MSRTKVKTAARARAKPAAKKTPNPKQNLTIQLDRDVIRRAKVVAAKQGTSVSGLVAKTLAELVAKEDDYQAAMKRALAFMKKGLKGTGGPYKREDLYQL